MINPTTFNTVSQISHALGGAFAMVCGAFLFGPHSLLYIGPAFVIYAAAKEFWYDFQYESAAVRGSSLEDFLFYLLGLFFGIGIVILKTHLG
jgi:hypothetical protein